MNLVVHRVDAANPDIRVDSGANLVPKYNSELFALKCVATKAIAPARDLIFGILDTIDDESKLRSMVAAQSWGEGYAVTFTLVGDDR